MKKCPYCEKKYPADLNHFGYSGDEKDNLTIHCRDCCVKIIREHEKIKKFLNSSVTYSMSNCLRKVEGANRWKMLVGYDIEDLRQHITSQFTKGMTWDNYGDWHIDHIKPLSHFDYESTDDSEFKECWSLWNLQPLWAKENYRKRDRCDNPPLPLLPAT